MDSINLVVLFAVIFTTVVTFLNWSDLDPLNRVLFPLWILGMCLPIF